MPTLVMRTGRKIDVTSAHAVPHGLLVVLHGGGSLTVPHEQVARVEQADGPQPRAPSFAVGGGFIPPDPNIGRPTSANPPFGTPPMPLGFPPNENDLDHYSTLQAMQMAGRDAANWESWAVPNPNAENDFRGYASHWNAMRPEQAFDAEALMESWRGNPPDYHPRRF